MDLKPTSAETKVTKMVDTIKPDDSDPECTTADTAIYIDPEKEAAALKKFDKFLLPVAFLFLVLSSLDRSNVLEYPMPRISLVLTV